MKTFALVNQKGGVGKTTTALNLAACLAATERRVLLFDLDPQGNATSGLGVNKNDLKSTTYDVIVKNQPISEAILDTKIPDLKIVPTNTQLVAAEIELVSAFSRERRLTSVLSQCENDFDYIFIDCPPSLGLLTVNALSAAQGILVPVQCEYYALEGLSELTQTIEMIQKHLNPQLETAGIILTMYDGRNNLSRQVAEEVEAFFQDKVFSAKIPRNVKLSESPSHGLPILLYDAFSKGAESYMSLTAEFIHRFEPNSEQNETPKEDQTIQNYTQNHIMDHKAYEAIENTIHQEIVQANHTTHSDPLSQKIYKDDEITDSSISLDEINRAIGENL
ncbi:MAG: ParA family protein [Deltaproteobacteria bacterium]|nr:ParA family protein [Deltaproteobacteria bacterium]